MDRSAAFGLRRGVSDGQCTRRRPTEAENAGAEGRPAAVGSTAPLPRSRPPPTAFLRRRAEVVPPRPSADMRGLTAQTERGADGATEAEGATGPLAAGADRSAPPDWQPTERPGAPRGAGATVALAAPVGQRTGTTGAAPAQFASCAVEQWTAQPPLACGTRVQTTESSAEPPPKPRTLTPKVGLQRWVLPPTTARPARETNSRRSRDRMPPSFGQRTGAPTSRPTTGTGKSGEAPTPRSTGGGAQEGRSADLSNPKRQRDVQRLRGTRSKAVEQMDAQPRGAEGVMVSRSYGDADAQPKLRTLPPHVGLQRRVRRLLGNGSVGISNDDGATGIEIGDTLHFVPSGAGNGGLSAELAGGVVLRLEYRFVVRAAQHDDGAAS